MSAPRIVLASLSSFCKKLSKLVEIWHKGLTKTNLHIFWRLGVVEYNNTESSEKKWSLRYLFGRLLFSFSEWNKPCTGGIKYRQMYWTPLLSTHSSHIYRSCEFSAIHTDRLLMDTDSLWRAVRYGMDTGSMVIHDHLHVGVTNQVND